MTVALDAPALSPSCVLVLESVLAIGSSPTSQVRRSTRLAPAAFEAAVSSLVGLGLVRVDRIADGTVVLRPGAPPQVQRFVRRGGLVPLAGRAVIDARRSLDWVLTQAGPQVERLTDLDQILERIQRAFLGCRSEVLNVHHGPPMPEQAMHASVPFDADLVGRGLRVCNVSPVDHLRIDYVRDVVDRLDDQGVGVRFADATPHRILVLDGRSAFIPIDANDESAGALVVAEPALVGSLRFLANALFTSGVRAADVGENAELPSPSAQDRRVLELMNSGVTDVVAARKLGVTERQFRRYVASIMESLGAESRFQAGVRAVERGWL